MGKTGKILLGVAIIAATFIAPVAGLATLAIGKLAVGSVLLGAARLAGLGLINSALAPKKDTKLRTREMRTQAADPQAFVPVIYGEVEMAPRIINLSLEDADPFFLILVGGMCHGSRDGGGIQSILSLRMDNGNGPQDVMLTEQTSPVTAWANTNLVGSHTGFTKWAYHDGDETQIADTGIIASLADWTTDHRLRGIAYVGVRMSMDRQAASNEGSNAPYDSGSMPKWLIGVKGNRLFDVRTSTWAWSDNPALVLYDYLLSDKYGAGLDAADLDTQSFIDAANFCDATVNAHTRFTCNAFIDPAEGIETNIRLILSSMRGTMLLEGGVYKLHINDADSVSGVKIGEDDLVGSISISLPSSNAAPNQIVAQYINPDNAFEVGEVMWPAPGAANSMLTDDNGKESRMEIDLPFTFDRRIAEEIAMVTAREVRSATTVAFVAKQVALEASVGDLIELTAEDFGWTDKQIRVWALEPLQDGLVAVSGVTHNSASYSLDANTTVPTVPGTDLPDPSIVPAPTSLTLTSNNTTLVTDELGNVLQYIKATWTASQTPFLDREEVFFKKNADAEWTLVGSRTGLQLGALAAQEYDRIGPVEIDVLYDVKIEAVNTLGIRSTPLAGQVTPTTGTDTPDNPATLTIDYNTLNGVISMTWDFLADTGTNRLIRFYEIRYGATWAGGTVLGTAFANVHSFLASQLGTRSTTLWVGAVSRFGTESVTPISAAWSDPQPDATQVTGGDVALSSRQGNILLTVNTTDVDAQWMNVYGSLSSGFTPGDANRLVSKAGVTNGPGTVAGFPLPDTWGGATFYIKLGFTDILSDPLSEAEQISSEFSSTGSDSDYTLDPDVGHFTLAINSSGNVTAEWTSNAGTNSVRIATSTSGYPSLATTQAAAALNGRTGTTGTLDTITVGEILYATLLPYSDGVGNTTEGPLAKAQIQRVPSTSVEIGAQPGFHVGPTAPGGTPAVGDIWVEDDQTPPVVYYWTGTGWNDVGLLGQGALALLDLVDTLQIADDAITLALMDVNSVDTAQLVTDAVTQVKMAVNSVDTDQIVADAVTSTKVAVNAIYTNAIQTDAITNTKIGPLAVDTPELNAGAITSAKIEAGAVIAGKIGALAVDTAELAAGAITAGKIDAGAVIAGKIGALAVDTAELAAGAVTAAKIQALTITSDEIAALTITASEIKARTITAGKMVLDTLTASEIATINLSTISANVGLLTAGVIQNAAGTRYIDLGASGTEEFIKHEALVLLANGDATFSGTVSATTFDGTNADFQSNLHLSSAGAQLTVGGGYLENDTLSIWRDEINWHWGGIGKMSASIWLDSALDDLHIAARGIGTTTTPPSTSILCKSNGNVEIQMGTSGDFFYVKGGTAVTFYTRSEGDVYCGNAAKTSTSRTDNLLWIPICGGAPTGGASSTGGRRAIIFDYTNNRLYVRNASSWKYVQFV